MRILRPGTPPAKPEHIYGLCPRCNGVAELDKFTRECPTPGCTGAMVHLDEGSVLVRGLLELQEPTEGA